MTIESSAAAPIELGMRRAYPTPIATAPAAPRAFSPIDVFSDARLRAQFPSWRAFLSAAFVVGATLNMAWLALGAVQAIRLQRSARIADARIQRLMVNIAGDRRQPIQILVSDRIGLPVAIGVLQPMIVLPVKFVAIEPDDCLEAALAHEWAHVCNGDLRRLALLRLLNVVLYVQPLFWFLRRSIRADQEMLADAAASTLHGDGRLAYAETLVGWARSSHRQQPVHLASAAIALWERPSMLRRACVCFSIATTASSRLRRALEAGSRLHGFARHIIALDGHATAVGCDGTRNEGGTASDSEPDPRRLAQSNVHRGSLGILGPCARSRWQALRRRKTTPGLLWSYRSGPARYPRTSDSQGYFRIAVRKQDFVDTDNETPSSTAQVVGTAYGFGLGWADAGEWADVHASEPKKIDPRNLTVRLTGDHAPISGRIVDLEGRPLAGVIIRPGEILEPKERDLSTFIAASTNGKGGSVEIEREYFQRKLWPRGSGLPSAIATDNEGRFLIRGVGASAAPA